MTKTQHLMATVWLLQDILAGKSARGCSKETLRIPCAFVKENEIRGIK